MFAVLMHMLTVDWLGSAIGELQVDTSLASVEVGDSPSSRDRETLWSQYQLHVDLYKFYLELSLKAVTFSYFVTGAIIAYCLAHPMQGMARFGLLLPAIMNAGLSVIFLYGARLNDYIRIELENIAKTLRLENAPEVTVLTVVLYVFAGILGTTALCLVVLMSVL